MDEPAAVEWLVGAVKTPSVTGRELAFAQRVAAELERCGADDVHLEEVAPGRPIVWSVSRGSGSGPSLMLAGHLDTVRVDGWRERWAGTEREDPFGAPIVDGAVWGRGAADLKGGVAMVIAALSAVHRSDEQLAGDVVTLWVCDEESGEHEMGRSLGMRAAVERMSDGRIPRPDFAIYVEPTGLAVLPAQIGFLIADVTLHGRSAYFGRAEEGIDALRATHSVLSALWGLDARLRARPAHPLLGTPGLLVTHTSAGGYIAVPGTASLSLIRTLVPGEDLAAAGAEIEEAVRAGVRDTGVEPEIRFPAGRDHDLGGRPAEVDPAIPAIGALRAAVRAVAPQREGTGGAPFWSEMSFLSGAGVPCVYWAPGDIAHCHTPEEHLDLEEFLDGVKALSLFMADHCGVGQNRGGESS